MKRFYIMLIIAVVAFLFVNIWILSKGMMKGAADYIVSAEFEEIMLFSILQIIVIVNYLIAPLKEKKHKIVYWCVSEPLVLLTFLFWGIIVVGPIWLQ